MKFFFDFLPVVLFFLVYKFYGDIPASYIEMVNQLPYVELVPGDPKHALIFATLVLIFASILQNVLHWLMYRRFEKMHLISMGILVVFGSLTIVLKDPNFIKWKVTIFNWIFAIVILGSLFFGEKTLIERMMGQALTVSSQIWRTVTVYWGVFFFIIGVLNLIVAFGYPGENDTNWVNFKLFGILGLTFAFIIGQALYLSKHSTETAENS